MPDISSNNKRIAKNTVFLYFRMFLIMAVSLYTSRVVLSSLGINDFGIYNVVGGFVSMFGFFNTAMISTTQRYITYAIGVGDKIRLQKIFSNCVLTHGIISLIVLILCEILGLWFLYNKMVIPPDRLSAAFWVFQFSIVSTIVMIMSVPYNAEIVAHEKMSAFAYISIFEVILKLVIVYLLVLWNYDKLIIYGLLLLVVQIFIRYIYSAYCKKHFLECRYIYKFDSKLFQEMFSFAGWNLWGGISNIMYTQGLNLLLNIFFGPSVNAARGVSVQIQSAVAQFANSFQMAINPQIIKTYAKHEMYEMHQLVFRATKFSFFLLFIVAVPIFLKTEFLLSLWLVDVPNWTASFVRVMLLVVLVDSTANPLMISSAATGKIKLYQTIIGGTMLLIVPVAYVLLKEGFNPVSVFFVHFAFCLITFVLRLFVVKPLIKLSIKEYIIKALFPIVIVFFSSCLFSLFVIKCYDSDTTIYNVCIIISSIVATAIFCFFLGLTTRERAIIMNKVFNFKDKIK